MGTQRTLFFVVLFTLPMFLAAYSLSLSESLRSNFFSLTKPVLNTSQEVSANVAQALYNVRRFFLLYQENDKLQNEVDLLEKQIILLREQEKENVRLRSLLDFKRTTPSRTVAAQLIARDVTHLSNWAVIDKGSSDGLKKEMSVVNEQGLVGKVVEVGPHTARMILLTDVESKVSGLLQESRETGLVLGDGSPYLRMKFIDLDSQLKVGDEIVSSGLGGIYPKGIPIGKVESIGREKNGLHLFAKIKPSVSFSKIEEVLCLDYQQPS